MARLTVKIKIPWYASVYFNTVTFIANTLNMEPEAEKVAKTFSIMIGFGMRIERLCKHTLKIIKTR